jgi:transposase
MAMYAGQLVFSQVMTYLPLKAFSRMVSAHRAQHKVKDFSCLDQFLVLAFAQLTTRESLRDIEINLRAQKRHFYHMGLRCKTISRNTLANANRVRPWEVFADLAHHLIGTARTLYAKEPTNAEFKSLMGATVYALDSTTIDLCLSLFSWAPFRTAKAAIKLHTLIDLKGSIPSFIHISDGKMHDVKVLDILCKQGYIEAGAFYVMDKAYVDYARLFQLHTARAFFVTRTKDNIQAQLVQEFTVDTSAGLISDRHVRLTGLNSAKRYPEALRCVRFTDPESNKTLEFLTNNFALPAITICALYKQRWQVELFFKWIKQHLRIKSFYGTTENAVKTQVWIAISTYVLIAIMKKRLNLQHSLYEILRVLDLNMFEIVPIADLLGQIPNESQLDDFPVQQDLFQTLGH